MSEITEAMEAARLFIEQEYRDPSAEIDGEWLAQEARPVHAMLCQALYSAAKPVEEDAVENAVRMLIQSAREREAASRLPDCIEGAQRRLDQARETVMRLASPQPGNDEVIERVRAAITHAEQFVELHGAVVDIPDLLRHLLTLAKPSVKADGEVARLVRVAMQEEWLGGGDWHEHRVEKRHEVAEETARKIAALNPVPSSGEGRG